MWERLLDRLINSSKEELFEWLFTAALVEIQNPEVVRPGEQVMNCGACPVCDGTGLVVSAIPYYDTESSKVEGQINEEGCNACAGSGYLRVYMTPDGIHIEDEVLEEWKHTSKSCKYGIDQKKFDRWTKWQIPAYLKSLGLLKCRLRVYFVRGDYTDNTPQWREGIITYTQQEIDEVWDAICLNARALILMSV